MLNVCHKLAGPWSISEQCKACWALQLLHVQRVLVGSHMAGHAPTPRCAGNSQHKLGTAAACAVKRIDLDARVAAAAKRAGANLTEGFEVRIHREGCRGPACWVPLLETWVGTAAPADLPSGWPPASAATCLPANLACLVYSWTAQIVAATSWQAP